MLVADTEAGGSPQKGVALLVHSLGNEACAITRHPLHYERNRPVLLAGSPFAQSDLIELPEVLRRERPPSTPWLEPNILALDHSQIIWYEKSQVRPMWFRGQKRSVAYDVPWPALAFRACAKGLYVAALASDRRPTPATPLYHAPLFNIYANGALCPGNSELPQFCRPEDCGAWSDLIYRTINTHINHRATLKPTYLGKARETSISTPMLRAFWRTLHRDKISRFPRQALNPLGVRVGRISDLEGAAR